jgi:hypothetical protein
MKRPHIRTISGAVVVQGKIPQRLIALEESGNGKSRFDADDVLANEAWEVDVLFGIVGGCGSGKDHQVRLLKKLLIRPNANNACGDDAGEAEEEGSCKHEQADSFHIVHLTESAAKCSYAPKFSNSMAASVQT